MDILRRLKFERHRAEQAYEFDRQVNAVARNRANLEAKVATAQNEGLCASQSKCCCRWSSSPFNVSSAIEFPGDVLQWQVPPAHNLVVLDADMRQQYNRAVSGAFLPVLLFHACPLTWRIPCQPTRELALSSTLIIAMPGPSDLPTSTASTLSAPCRQKGCGWRASSFPSINAKLVGSIILSVSTVASRCQRLASDHPYLYDRGL